MNFEQIIKDLQNKVYYPVYLLSGEEVFYIDIITDLIERTILTDAEKEFNFTVLYGKDTNADEIATTARRYPMMANYQVVIVKEAQELDKIEKLQPYFEKPLKSTILLLCYKYKKPDKRKKYATIIEKTGVLFHSEKLREDKIPLWLKDHIDAKGYKITNPNIQLLADTLGNDLTTITNELEKIFINLPKGALIDKQHIEDHIGINKEYNIFELQHQLAKKNHTKVFQIIDYFAKHPKENALVKTIAVLFEFYIRVLTVQQLQAKKMPDKDIAVAIERSPFFLNDFKMAARNYTTVKLISIIEDLRTYDLKYKGVNFPTFSEAALYKELFFRILH